MMFRLAVIASCAVLFVGNVFGQTPARIMVGPNVLVSWQADASYHELHSAADPTNPKRLLVAGMRNLRDDPTWNARISQAFVSNDSGNSWVQVTYPQVHPDWVGGDPQVAWGSSGTGYFVALGLTEKEDQVMFLSRSEDGGRNWEKPLHLTTFLDHEQIVVDQTTSKFAGTVYMAGLYDIERGKKFGGAGDAHIGVYHSHDDGKTWTNVDIASNHDLPGHRLNSCPSPVVFSDGEVLVPFKSFPTTPDAEKADQGKSSYFYVSSHDGGASFGKPQPFEDGSGAPVRGADDFYLAVDHAAGPFRDRLYAMWTDHWYDPFMHLFMSPDKLASVGEAPAGQARLWLAYSTDHGKTWFPKKMVSPGALGVGDQFMPAIAVNAQGVVGISWYEARDSKDVKDSIAVNQRFAASVDGGVTFLPPVRVSSVATELRPLTTHVFGEIVAAGAATLIPGWSNYRDYFSLTASSDGIFHPFWIDARAGSHQLWTASVRVQSDGGQEQAVAEKFSKTDVSEKIGLILDPLNEYAPAGTVEMPLRLKNLGDKPIYGPLEVSVATMNKEASLLNGGDGKNGIGATMDYSRALGDFDVLAPGAVSEAIIWRFKAPTNPHEFPRFGLKVVARTEEGDSAKTK